MTRKTEYVSDVQRYTRSIWDSLNALQSLQAEWNALDYGNTLGLQSANRITRGRTTAVTYQLVIV